MITLKKIIPSDLSDKVRKAIRSVNDDGTMTIDETMITGLELATLMAYLLQEGYGTQ